MQRFGAVDAEFLEWAAQYDYGTLEGRSLKKQHDWLAARGCQIVKLEGDLTVEERVQLVLNSMPNLS